MERTFDIKLLEDQTSQTVAAYRDYICAKQEINEVPLTFDLWAEMELEAESPISFYILTTTTERLQHEND